jgi:hypothetical protein
MSRWSAYYFDGLEPSLAPSRVISIEAADEDEAGEIAISKMGRSMRVHVAEAHGLPPTQTAVAEQLLAGD